MCLAIVWRAWWWRDGKASFDLKRRVEEMDDELARIILPDLRVHGASSNIESCEALEIAGAELPHSRSVTFRGN